MRIIGGRFKGQRPHLPKRMSQTRPTTDFARESLFNILHNRVDWEDLRVLELFAGTGSLGLEALSRGAASVQFVEQHPACVAAIQQTLADWKLSETAQVRRAEVGQFLRQGLREAPFDLILADPPYALAWLTDLPQLILEGGFLAEGGLLVLEHGAKQNFGSHPLFQEERRYGQVRFSFFGL